MYEWMHDWFVVEKMQTDFMSKTKEDCCYFINNSQSNDYIHLAIVDDEDVYMGTVSLKHMTKRNAEFAITVCREVMGKGYAIAAMKEIIKLGFEKYGLSDIYWCVASDNTRALRFYNKNGFQTVDPINIDGIEGYTNEQIRAYTWYQISKVSKCDS